jgi:hypothetical protein
MRKTGAERKMTSHSRDDMLKQEAERARQKVAILEDRVRLLEQENHAFAEMLKERGVEVHPISMASRRVPPAITDPSPQDDVVATLTSAEGRLYRELCGSDRVVLLLLTESMAEVGLWMWKRRVWLCVTDQALVLFAEGRKPIAQRTPYAHIGESLFNHVTGELVLAPDRKYRLGRVKLQPKDGYQVLAQIYHGVKQDGKREKVNA